jgi:hypothetical protein
MTNVGKLYDKLRSLRVKRITIGKAIILVLLLATQALRAEVLTSLNRNTIYTGDTVVLTVEVNGEDLGEEPDLSVLRQAFHVLGTSSKRQVQITNGRRTDKQQWSIELEPKQAGNIIVPAIRVGNSESLPLMLMIEEPPAALAASTDQPVFLRAVIEESDSPLYVQQQVQFKLQLYYSESLLNGSFEEPNIENALVERLGEDVQYSTVVNGQEYQVAERHYAIFPEQSGELVIPSVIFTGQMAGARRQNLPHDRMNDLMKQFMGRGVFTQPGKRVRLRSDAITLDVQPRPDAYTGQFWLPSEQLELRDSWADGRPEFRAGEPVTRTITLVAKGLESSHLPDIVLTDSKGMRLYPEQPVHDNKTDGDWVFGSSKQTVAYVPSATGITTIPEIRVDWWDTRDEQQRTAVLPAREVRVLPGADGLVAAPITSDPEKAGQTNAVVTPVMPQVNGKAGWLQVLERYRYWLVAVMVLLLTVLFVMNWTRLPAARKKTGSRSINNKERARAARKALQTACSKNDASSAAAQWAAATWPDGAPRNLGALSKRLVRGAPEIRELEQALYAANADAWNGAAFWTVFGQGLNEVVADKQKISSGLLPLYPDWK